MATFAEAYADQNKVFLHGFGSDIGNGHWNASGHRVAAGQISAGRLTDANVVRSRGFTLLDHEVLSLAHRASPRRTTSTSGSSGTALLFLRK